MKILIAPDSFKESLTAKEVALCLEKGIKNILPDAETVIVPMADGGEGTVQSLVDATEGEIKLVEVMDPLFRPVPSFYGMLGDGKTAIIEMAAASGLMFLKPEERNPLVTSTFGTGQLIKNALDNGCTKLIIGIGGSATNDGGAGVFCALGGRLWDADGNDLLPGGGNLNRLAKIDTSGVDVRLQNCEILVACDVTNPLCGPNGASKVYGPQKGATTDMVMKLDENLSHYGKILEKHFIKEIINIPGAGAAGGLGAGLLAFFNARLIPGFEIVAQITNLATFINNCDLVFTGEGKIDFQTQFGKTPFGVAQMAQKAGKPVIAFAGSVGKDTEILYTKGFTCIMPVCSSPVTLQEAISGAAFQLEQAAERTIRLLLNTF